MTGSDGSGAPPVREGGDPHGPADARRSLLPPGWREQALAQQEEVLPAGRVVVTCGVPYGKGGLGRHLAEICEALERAGRPGTYLAEDNRRERPARRPALLERLTRRPPAERILRARTKFDEYAARNLPEADALMAFNRQALAQFGRAGELGYRDRMLVTGSPHVMRVARQHGLSFEQEPIEPSFGTAVEERYLREYELADAIYVASHYTLESFVEGGVERERLRLFPLTPDPRFTPGPATRDTFDVVYVGSLSVAKGTSLLVRAFRALSAPDLRLRLVGNTKSPPMRHWLEREIAADPRITVGPGDPLPVYRAAGLCVHPTWEDGFAYAPAEALACGVPVAVSADTGMRELIRPGVSGVVLPTGDASAITAAIEAAYRGELVVAER